MTDRSIVAYYDNHVDGKLKGFTDNNPRIELAWRTVIQNTPVNPTHILEIGCGIGDTAFRMGKKWKNAQVVGIDISPRSIEIAEKLFGSHRVKFKIGLVDETFLKTSPTKFDLILMMDVYEHISASERSHFHHSIKTLLSDDGQLILTCPTPRYLAYLRENVEGGLQPVDENVDFNVIAQLASDTGLTVVLYKEVEVWHPGDYVHIILSKKDAPWTRESYQRQSRGSLFKQITRKFKRLLKTNPILSTRSFRKQFVERRLRSKTARFKPGIK